MRQSGGMLRLNLAVNLVVIAIAVFLIGQPDGPVRSKLEQLRAEAAQRDTISLLWSELREGPRIDDLPVDSPLIIEFSDYQCPFCREAHGRLGALAAETGIGVVYRHMPLSAIHPRAEGAARAAICAEHQGFFPAMHERLFSDSGWQQSGDWMGLAIEIGIPNLPRFRDCLAAPETSERLSRDLALAERLGARATPTFAGLGGVASGVPRAETLREIAEH